MTPVNLRVSGPRVGDAVIDLDRVVAAAVAAGARSPCAKSKRGVALYDFALGEARVVARAWNSPPPGFACDGSAACRAACREVCVHAEIAALITAGPRARGRSLLHVKVVDGRAVPGGGPSCVGCSRAIVQAGIRTVRLLEERDGDVRWVAYSADEFHALSLAAHGFPVTR